MIDAVVLHAGASRMPLPHAVVDGIIGMVAGLVILAAFYLFLRFYAGSSRSDL